MAEKIIKLNWEFAEDEREGALCQWLMSPAVSWIPSLPLLRSLNPLPYLLITLLLWTLVYFSSNYTTSLILAFSPYPWWSPDHSTIPKLVITSKFFVFSGPESLPQNRRAYNFLNELCPGCPAGLWHLTPDTSSMPPTAFVPSGFPSVISSTFCGFPTLCLSLINAICWVFLAEPLSQFHLSPLWSESLSNQAKSILLIFQLVASLVVWDWVYVFACCVQVYMYAFACVHCPSCFCFCFEIRFLTASPTAD